jgi:hypothetical protein
MDCSNIGDGTYRAERFTDIRGYDLFLYSLFIIQDNFLRELYLKSSNKLSYERRKG